MMTTCHICGQTDDSDLSRWGQSPDLGWYHLKCASTASEQATAKPEWVKNARPVTGGTTGGECVAVQAKRLGMNIQGQCVDFYRERPISIWKLYADGSVTHVDEVDAYLLKTDSPTAAPSYGDSMQGAACFLDDLALLRQRERERLLLSQLRDPDRARSEGEALEIVSGNALVRRDLLRLSGRRVEE